MFNLQGSEIIFILLLALVVLGPEKLPSAVRRFTQTYAELRKMGTGFQSELKSALDEPMREMRETAGLIRDQADPAKIAAESEAAAAMKAQRDAERKLDAQRPVAGAAATTAETAPPEEASEGDDIGTASDVPVPDALVDEPASVDEWADPVEPIDPDPPEPAASADSEPDESMEERSA